MKDNKSLGILLTILILIAGCSAGVDDESSAGGGGDVLSPPSGITVEPTSGGGTVTLTSVDGADSYKIYYNDTGNDVTKDNLGVDVPSGTIYVFDDLTNYKTYYLKATAKRGEIESDLSEQYELRPVNVDTAAKTETLVPEAGSSDIYFGNSFALAESGGLKYTIVGTPKDSTNGHYSGAAYIYRMIEVDGNSVVPSLAKAIESQQIGKIHASDPNAEDQFGYIVSASSYNGIFYFIATTPLHNVDNLGAVYVYRFDPSVDSAPSYWKGMTTPSGVAYSRGGVSLAQDGIYFIFGAIKDPVDGVTNAGTAYIGRIEEGTQQLTVVKALTAPHGEVSENAFFGWSVAIDYNDAYPSNSKAVVCSMNNSCEGSCYVFGGTNFDFIVKLYKDNNGECAAQGSKVAISGSSVIVGAPNKDEDKGAAYIYEFDGSTFSAPMECTSDGEKIGADKAGGLLGSSIDIKEIDSDVKLAFIGAPNTDGKGAVYCCRKQSDGWKKELKLNGGDGNVSFGRSVFYKTNQLWVGDDGANNYTGELKVFK